uniref:exodeoxyribonuclease III n=1 Tax=Leptobrachium leishanense TaxID=445787 RepID=A0A8C5N388_9ANUR
MTLKLTSLNVKGLNSPNKRQLLLRTLKSDRVNIAFIQETHLVKHAKAVLTDHVFTREFSSRALSKRNGVSILIRKSCPFQGVLYKYEVDGRYVLLSGSLYSKTYHFLNVYAPNASATDFWSSICAVLDTLPHGTIVLGGDMNATPCPAVDISDRPVLSELPSVSMQDKTFARFLQRMGLIDVWHVTNPSVRDYTFYSAPHGSHSRIDLFLLNGTTMSHVIRAEINSISWSDHADIALYLHTPRVAAPWSWR